MFLCRLSEVNVGLLNMTTGSYKVVDKPLKMGQLSGNAFRIVIRDVHQNEGIHKRYFKISSLAENRFPYQIEKEASHVHVFYYFVF